MLFITTPKSASSSLVYSVAKEYECQDLTKEIRSKYFSSRPTASGYEGIKPTHSEFIEISQEIVDYLEKNGDHVFKHHFPPTENNQKLLENIPKVILLRSPEDVIRSYKKGDETGVFPIQDPRLCFCFSDKDWFRKAKEIGLFSALDDFNHGWWEHEGDKLVITYDQLIENPKKVMKRIQKYFGLEEKDITLGKKRYTKSKKPRPLILVLILRYKLYIKRIFSLFKR